MVKSLTQVLQSQKREEENRAEVISEETMAQTSIKPKGIKLQTHEAAFKESYKHIVEKLLKTRP